MLGKCPFFIALLSSSVILLLLKRAKEIDSDEESEESGSISNGASKLNLKRLVFRVTQLLLKTQLSRLFIEDATVTSSISDSN